MEVVSSATSGVDPLGEALSHRRSLLLEPGGEHPVESRTGIQQQYRLRAIGEGEMLHRHSAVGCGLHPYPIAQLNAVESRRSLLRLFPEPDIQPCGIWHERDVAATTAAAHTRQAVDAETGDEGYFVIVARVLPRFAVGAHLNLAIGNRGPRCHLTEVIGCAHVEIHLVKPSIQLGADLGDKSQGADTYKSA